MPFRPSTVHEGQQVPYGRCKQLHRIGEFEIHPGFAEGRPCFEHRKGRSVYEPELSPESKA
jgi:hypothetical protein